MKIILASNSPRRKQLFAGLDLPFEVRIIDGIDESYPKDLPAEQVAEAIACSKASFYEPANDEIILTADTTVVIEDTVLGKPANREEAIEMLRMLSGKTHRVITGVCLKSVCKQKNFSVISEVTFKDLLDSEIFYYVDRYKPFDKAGAYGIQEWIGFIGVSKLNGSYFNVMGLPVQRIYEELHAAFL